MSTTAPQLHHFDLGDGVEAFCTTRHGGVSKGAAYASFNINPYCGDAPESVAANRVLLCRTLGIDDSHLVLPHQTHGTVSRTVGAEFTTLPPTTRSEMLEGVDAVMTDVPGLCVGVSTADCIPILLHDPKHHAVCAVHAGWRGTLARITHKAVADMRAAYGTNPADLVAAIGPGISLDAFEVGDEVYELFAAADFNLDAAAERREQWHLDLPQLNRQLLIQCGVDEQNIAQSDICTYNHSDDFFSARRLGVESGRIFNGIMLDK